VRSGHAFFNLARTSLTYYKFVKDKKVHFFTLTIQLFGCILTLEREIHIESGGM